MIARQIPVALAVIAGGTIIWGWWNLTLLRGTVFWEFRFVTLAVAAFLVLSLAQWLSGKIVALSGGDSAE